MEKTMTPPDLVRRLRAEWSDAVAALDGWPGSPTKEMVLALVRAGDDLSAALASPPEAPADLVALWSEYREAFQVDPEEQEDDGPRYQRLVKAHRALLDWTPPAASGPPAAPPETVKECAWLVETYILSLLHYLRSWNVRHSKPEWTSNIDEAWRFARREDADKALVYLAAGEGRVAEHL